MKGSQRWLGWLWSQRNEGRIRVQPGAGRREPEAQLRRDGEGVWMMGRFGKLVGVMVAVGICLTLAGGVIETAPAAETCTWSGAVSTDWHEPGNWDSCVGTSGDPKEPGGTDAVIIGAGASQYPVLGTYHDTIAVETLTIEVGGSLTVDENVSVSASQFTNHGTIVVEEETGHGLHVYAPFDNHGTVNTGAEGFLALHMAGTHSGDFRGRYLSFPTSSGPEENVFGSTSSIDVEYITFRDGRMVTIDGQFACRNLFTLNGEGAVVTISTAGLIDLGTLNVVAGELILEMDGGTYSPVGTMMVPAGGSLEGTGTIDGDLENGGTVSPGASPGTLSVTGAYTQTASGGLEIELGGTVAGTGYDQLVVDGAAALDGTLVVSLIDGFTPAAGQVFTVLQYGSHTGAFEEVILPDPGEGLRFRIDYSGEELSLIVEEESQGSISGTVTYTGKDLPVTHVEVALHLALDQAPVATQDVLLPGGPYTFGGMPDGSYYVSAVIDVNDSGGAPDPDDLVTWYDADDDDVPDLVGVSGDAVTGIDLALVGELYEVFLPLVVSGTP